MSLSLADEAAALAATDPDLMALIRFSRSHDPTARLRAAWADAYGERASATVAKVLAALQDGTAFAGSADEVLLAMAHTVAAAPYAGLPEDAVRDRLRGMVGLLPAALGGPQAASGGG